MIKDLLLNKRFLFYMSVITTSIIFVIGYLVNIIFQGELRNWINIFVGIIVLILSIFLAFSFVFLVANYFKKDYDKSQNVLKLYFKDQVFRVKVNSVFSSLFAFSNGVIYYTLSYFNYGTFYFLTSLIFFLIFLTKLYLLLEFFDKEIIKHILVFVISIIVSLLTIGISVILYFDDSMIKKKDLIIYWNALYTFTCFISSMVSLIKTFKHKDFRVEKFFTVRFINAMYSMLVLEVFMLVTFTEGGFNDSNIYLISGLLFGGFMILVAVLEFIFSFKHRKEMNKNLPS